MKFMLWVVDLCLEFTLHDVTCTCSCMISPVHVAACVYITDVYDITVRPSIDL